MRLRQAERASPAGDVIVDVRGDLEAMVGPTVRRAAAARLLGVSQTALDRWIAKGDVPVVLNPHGGRQVPLNSLVELAADVEERRAGGDPNPLASVLRRRRSDAEKLDLGTTLPARDGRPRGEGPHRGPELRSLAYHRAVAQRLDARVVEDARSRLRRWRSQGRIDGGTADRWDEILSWPAERIATFIGDDSEEARALRQSSPFAGILSEREREHVLAAVAERARGSGRP